MTDTSKNNNLFISLFLISLSVLCYELLIIRVLSVIYEYELLFILISLSVCGLGLGGIFYYKMSDNPQKSENYLKICSYIFPLSFGVSLWVITSFFHLISLVGSIFFMLIPFLAGGMLMSAFFAKHINKSNTLYFFDLAGGGCGCLLSIPLMHYFGGIDSILGTAVVASIATILMYRKYIPLILTSLLLLININFSFINLGLDKIKKTTTPLGQTLNYPGLKTAWMDSSWDIYSRCDLVKASKNDIKRSIFINGGTKATMMRFDNDPSTQQAINRYRTSSILYFPYLFNGNESVLNIGSGGGRDVLFALLSGAKKVTAVEINQGVINMVNAQKEYNGDIYGFDNVTLAVEDGRTFIMRSEEKYDRIVLSLASTFAFSDMNSLAQMENYLYTKEAFKQYLDHLTDDGTLTIFIDFSELLEKFIMTGLEVIAEERSISYDKAMNYMSSFETEYTSGYGYVFMMRKAPYSQATVDEMAERANSFGIVPVYIPYKKSGNDFDVIAEGKLTPQKYIANNTDNLAPSTDNQPFFLEVVFNHRITLIILFCSITIILLITIVLFQTNLLKKMASFSQSSPQTPSKILAFIPYFLFIGTGFMLVEILLTKRFSFYLGYPHLNIAIILFSILMGTGTGSLLSGYIKRISIERQTIISSITLIVVLLIFEFTNNIFIEATIGLPLNTRAFLLIIYLLPISILLGFFFPAGMKMAGKIHSEEISWFWGINGIASVAGSVLSVVLAMSYGFHAVLYAAMLCYLGVAVCLFSKNIEMKDAK